MISSGNHFPFNETLDWRKLLAMGEQIAGLPSWNSQRGLIQANLKKFFVCEAEIWTIEPVILLPGEEKLDQEKPLTKLANEALTSRKIVWSKPKKNNLAVTMSAQDTTIGIIQIKRPAKLPFSQDEIDFLDALAAYSSVAIQVSRQSAIKNWRFEQLALVRSVSFQIANVLDLNELARRVTNLILNTFKYYYVAIFTIESGDDHLRFRASAKSLRPGDQTLSFSPSIGEGIIGYVAQTGSELVVGQVKQDPRYRMIDGLPETQSEVALPIKIESRILGVLDVQSDKTDTFHDIDLMVMRALADNIALAVEGARLYGAVSHRIDQIATVAEVSRVLASILDLDTLSKEVVNLIQKRFGYPFIHIFTVHPGRRKVFFQAGSGTISQAPQAIDLVYELDDPVGIIPWVARHGKTALVNDVSQDPRYRPSPLVPEKTCAEMTLPLAIGNEVLGVLDIQSDRKEAFDENDRSLFEALADNIAIAMRNATLYRSERWRRQVAESLRDVAGLISGNTALDQVLESILTELERNLPCDVAGIWLVDDEHHTEQTGDDLPGQPDLCLAAVHASDRGNLVKSGKIPHEMNAWLTLTLKADQPVIRSVKDPIGPLGAALSFPQDYSSIAIPLRAGNRALGVLALAHHTNGRYGSEAQSMTATFASYAAVAIENTRLYASSQEQAWISTVLLQVAEATQSITSIDELSAVVVRLAPLLVGVKGCALFLWDEDIEAFVLNSAYGVNPAQDDSSTHHPIFPGTNYAFDQLVATRQPVNIEDPMVEINLPESVALTLGSSKLVLIPMITHSGILGAFLVTQENINTGNNNPFSMGDQRLIIIQGIAQQTAIAIENIHLLEGKQEEAYVTAVLLQVAQAVVSMNDLDDILESIIHIMPILVGIDRCIIYLFDAEANQFYSTHSYCKSAKIEEELRLHPFHPGENPLLDTIWKKENPVVCPLDQITESPLDWKSLTVLDLEKAKNQLTKNKKGVVMGFPLLVKGTIYGVMLAEDAGSAGFKERRLEIITGIAQQAAMAIQNDLLQKEMVGRERLEREFQLAREIQETFLPSQLPTIPGWDLDVRWHTAREVGGDFYDIFELPDKRIGLVIADVSDKGMPAALYMTVTRTLIRATVLDIESPAKVLAHVNDLMLMNNENGMFVTAVYAILDPMTGNLIYSNAGHNLPLILHEATGDVESLAKGGIALGVIEEIHLQDHQITLKPDDCLFLYTDGATETFSPAGETFGDERLVSVVQASLGTTPNELLDAIDDALAAYRQNEPPSDDTTLLAIRRLLIVG
jgi:phosphoserine phosphatase RsbU/P